MARNTTSVLRLMQPTRDTDPPRRSVRGAGVELSVVEVGPPDAPAAVIAHGVGSSARFVVDAFADAAVGAGFRLVAYDLRGHGRSGPARGPADHTLDRHVADLAAVAASVGARLVGGVSLGAHAAMSACAKRLIVTGADVQDVAPAHDPGVEGLAVCLPAWVGRAAPGEGPHAAVADEIREVGLGLALDRATSDPAVAPWLRTLLRRDWTAADGPSLEAALMALDGGRAPDPATLRSVGAPAGVVGWPDDPGHPLAVAREWERHLPRAALETVTMEEVGRDVATLGAAAFRALGRARAQPSAPASS